MGSGYGFKCSKCGANYSVVTGTGFLFPVIYQETMQKVKDGEYGNEWQEIAKSHEHTAINCKEELYRCSCGHWEVTEVMDIYEKKSRDFLADDDYVMEEDLKKDYRLIREFKHICPECGKEMKKTRIRMCMDSENFKGSTKLECPECGTHNPPLPGMLMWD